MLVFWGSEWFDGIYACHLILSEVINQKCIIAIEKAQTGMEGWTSGTCLKSIIPRGIEKFNGSVWNKGKLNKGYLKKI